MSIKVQNLTHIFNKDTEMATYALKDVSFTLEEGSFTGLIGHTGSGKSTLIQHLNGLLKPDSGTVYFHGEDIFAKGYDLKRLRSRVGLVFQYPEYQLFEETVLKDVMFGPSNMGFAEAECREKALWALRLTGVSEDLYDHSPFELSGGQKRRVAIAGVLAMEPEVMILDEPAAGLDPKGRSEMLGTIARLHEERHMTILLVSHSMDDVAEYAGRLLVMNRGELAFDDTCRNVFAHYEELEAMGLSAPQMNYIVRDLRALGLPLDPSIGTVDEARDAILKALS